MLLLYLHAILVGFQPYRPRNVVIALSMLFALGPLFLGRFLTHTLPWIEIAACGTAVVLLATKNLGTIRAGSLSLLAAVWLFSEGKLRGIPVETSLTEALHVIWRNFIGHSSQTSMASSMIMLLETRLFWIFLGTVVAVAIHDRRHTISSISVPHVFIPFRKRFALLDLSVSPGDVRPSGPFDRLLAVGTWVSSKVLNTFSFVLSIVLYLFGNGGCIIVDVVMWSVDQFCRAIWYSGVLLLNVSVGVLVASVSSFGMFTRGLAVTCLSWILPFIIGLLAVRECAALSEMLSATVHQNHWSFGIVGHISGIVLFLTVGLDVALWAVDPRGEGLSWWRNTQVDRRRAAFSGSTMEHFKRVAKTNLNYVEAMVVRLVPTYFFALLGYDLLGRYVGGPYQFGYPFAVCLAMVLGTLIVNVLFGRVPFKVGRGQRTG
jgi:hypothetical protein